MFSCAGPSRRTAAPAASAAAHRRAAAATAASAGRRPLPRRRRRRVRRHVRRHDWTPARQAHAAVVLPIGIDPVRIALVDRHAVHLPDRQRDAGVPGRVRRRSEDAHAAVAGDDVVPGHGRVRIPPDVVTVAAPAAADAPDLAAVTRAPERAVRDEQMIRIVGRDADADVVAGAADEPAIPAHVLPRPPGVVRSPDRTLCFGSCAWRAPLHAVRAGLDQRVHPVAVRRQRRMRLLQRLQHQRHLAEIVELALEIEQRFCKPRISTSNASMNILPSFSGSRP